MHRAISLSPVLALALACASNAPEPRTLSASPLEVRGDEVVVVDHVLLVVDASSSIPAETLFVEEQTIIRTFAATMPEGDYEAGHVAFGGFDRDVGAMTAFDRSHVTRRLHAVRHLEQGTPLYKVLDEARGDFATRSGRASVVILTDGVPTDEFGREVPAERTLAAAAALAEAYDGHVCFHTVQIGDEEEGAVFLRRLSKVTECGSTRNGTTLVAETDYYALQRDVFVSASPAGLPAVAAGPPTGCAGPSGSPHDTRGCWRIPAVAFGFDRSQLESSFEGELEEVSGYLRQNPGLRVRVEGYTDSSGDAAYNESLSLQRAESVRDALVADGVGAERIDVGGRGEQDPLVSNDTLDNRRKNRRVEIRIIE